MDLVWQTGTQSHSRRTVLYFQLRDQLQVFPAGSAFADAAEELGPCHSHTRGPCLVLFKNMHLTPQQVNSWISSSFVERQVVRMYWLQQSIPAQPDRESLIKAIVSAPVPEGVTAVRLDVYPKTDELTLGDALLDAGYSTPMRPANYSHVLLVVCMPDTGLWRWSYIDKALLWRHSHEKPAHFSKSVATAINKIAEATFVLGLQLQQQQQQPQQLDGGSYVSQLPPPDSAHSAQQQQQQHPEQQQQPLAGDASHLQSDMQALTLQQQPAAASEPSLAANGQQQQPAPHQKRWAIDVGAAPGGWSSYLADNCGYEVIAIDPAELHPDVAARPGVHHIKARSTDALQEIDRLLQGRKADLLVCDANDHVKRLPTFLGPVLSRLKQGASVVITLKFHGRGMKSDDAGHELLAAALPELEPGRCVWLMANTLCERTYVTRKR